MEEAKQQLIEIQKDSKMIKEEVDAEEELNYLNETIYEGRNLHLPQQVVLHHGRRDEKDDLLDLDLVVLAAERGADDRDVAQDRHLLVDLNELVADQSEPQPGRVPPGELGAFPEVLDRQVALLGVSGEVHRLQQGLDRTEANRLSVRLELQADYYAGVWAHHADRMFDILEAGDIDEALNAFEDDDAALVALSGRVRLSKSRPDGSQVVRDAAGTVVLKMPARGYYFDPVHSPLANATSARDIDRCMNQIEGYDRPDHLDRSYEELVEVANGLLGQAMGSGNFQFLQKSIELTRPKTTLVIDRDRAGALGVSMQEIGQALSTLVGSGLPLDYSLETLQTLLEKAPLKRLAAFLLHQIRQGHSLSYSLGLTGGLFNEAYMGMVRAGEMSGTLDKVLAELTEGLVRIRDIARVELGARTYGHESILDGGPTVALAVYQSPGANALETMKEVRADLKRLAQQQPTDVQYQIILDTTRYVSAAINEIVLTLGLTCLLVIGVVFIFLQDWRATLIPAVTIPVSLIFNASGQIPLCDSAP